MRQPNPMSDSQLIKRKQAETIVKLFTDPASSFNDRSDYERDVEDVIRVLSPQFEQLNENFESSQIDSFAYDESSEVLQVIFTSGGCYHYFGVEKDKSLEMLEADSKGRFLNKAIKPYYPYAKVH